MKAVTFPTTPDCEIVSSRIVNASQELVFEAWTNPNHLKNWWGPKGFTNTFSEFDLRTGGKWKFVMHAPEQGNFQNECEFVKIEKPAEIAWIRISKPLFNVVATFDALSSNQTKIVFRMVFETPEESNKLRPFVVDKNEENFDRLEEELKKMTL
ncbi:SRPBCC family protein [Flavobacterium sp. MR2016-29]|uniref:SRPBCC family protein n=1 Tax=Flavobacterium sp. MR2016-29 TaxID=2783795 RepID=UPI00188C18C6|nr:SRPBCC family protein [Flavobacterium sp. MR2016-29]MBF4491013.1 SRPBCC family protein [Flavobacterium sp. MR2016-29]